MNYNRFALSNLSLDFRRGNNPVSRHFFLWRWLGTVRIGEYANQWDSRIYMGTADRLSFHKTKERIKAFRETSRPRRVHGSWPWQLLERFH